MIMVLFLIKPTKKKKFNILYKSIKDKIGFLNNVTLNAT